MAVVRQCQTRMHGCQYTALEVSCLCRLWSTDQLLLIYMSFLARASQRHQTDSPLLQSRFQSCVVLVLEIRLCCWLLYKTVHTMLLHSDKVLLQHSCVLLHALSCASGFCWSKGAFDPEDSHFIIHLKTILLYGLSLAQICFNWTSCAELSTLKSIREHDEPERTLSIHALERSWPASRQSMAL